MTKPRRIYLLSPKDLNPETIAVTFAKTSRSPQPFDQIAAELNDDRSAQFHEKWVVGYGHASVAEHAVLHLALENVSRLAIETIEGNRLASYTEKSTRYQEWDQDAFYLPDELVGHPLAQRFEAVCRQLFTSYQESIPKVKKYLQAAHPQGDDESDKAYDRRVQSAAVDVCRFLLPAASLANVGVTINARALEYAICKMLSSPLLEVQQIGERLKEVARIETPTLIKYAACNRYLVKTRQKMAAYTQKLDQGSFGGDFQLLSWNRQGQDEVLAAIIFRFSGGTDFQTCLSHVQALEDEQKSDLVADLLAARGKFDQPLREFEYAQMSMACVMDQGAYFEFKRHRMMTQTVQPLTADLGFALPKALRKSGCEEAYLAVMRQAARLYQDIADWNADLASYIIPNGFNRRVLFTMNLREAFNFIRLRAAPNAHFSIRRVAQRMAETIQRIYPLLGRYLDAPEDETWWEIESQYFSSMRQD